MRCFVAVGKYRWALLSHPPETTETADGLQRLRDEEWEQNLEINLPVGIYELEFFALEDEELGYRNPRKVFLL